MPYTVYKLTCACGKHYIGYTSKNLIERKRHHFNFPDYENPCNAKQHWEICCRGNMDNCYDEKLLTKIQTYDEAIYQEAKLIFENRNIGLGALNYEMAGEWINFLLSCNCGIELVVSSSSNDPIRTLVNMKFNN